MLITRTTDPKDLDIITKWWYQEWKDTYNKSGIQSYQQAREDVNHRIQNQRLVVFVAREGSQIISVAALVFQTNPVMPRARTWLSNVFTIPEYRCNGYGTDVVREVIRYTATMCNEPMIYLHCKKHLRGWYEELGFRVLGGNQGSPVLLGYTIRSSSFLR